MKKLLMILAFNSGLSAQEFAPMQFRQATRDDAPGIVDLINTHAIKDSDKIVILPKKFRIQSVQDCVARGRLFVAAFQDKSTPTPTIIGFKKLFCVTDEEEKDDILCHELHCIEQNQAVRGLVSVEQGDISTVTLTFDAKPKSFLADTTYIYNGADFTHPEHRNKGICSSMTSCAIKQVQAKVVENILKKKSSNIAMLYGLTQANTGAEVFGGRTPGIVKQFVCLAQNIAQELKCTPPLTFSLSKHPAFMPTFDPEAIECKPLAYSQSVPGFGYLLGCSLKQSKLAN